MSHPRRIRRVLLVTALVFGLGAGAAACGNRDGQGSTDADVDRLEGKVSQLRLEVQNLRQEVAALRNELEGAAGAVGTTSTTEPRATTTTTRA